MLVSTEVKEELKRFVRAKLWTDSSDPHGDENNEARLKYSAGALPLIILLDPDGKEIGRLPEEGKANFKISKEQMLEALRKIR